MRFGINLTPIRRRRTCGSISWGLTGNWAVRSDASALNGPDGRVAYQFHARDVNLVMGPARKGATVRFRVLLDGESGREAHGVDVDANGKWHRCAAAYVSTDPSAQADSRPAV